MTVFERASELGEVGAGLTVSPNAALVLAELGLKVAFEGLDPPTPHLGALHWKTGKVLSYEERDLEEYRSRFGALTRQVHRADLHRLLSNALEKDVIRLGHDLVDIEERANDVCLTFADGATASAEAVIACDGLKSYVRTSVFSPEPASFTGFVAWRGLVKARHLPGLSLDPHFATYPSPDKLFVRYPVRSGTLINYVAIARKKDFLAEGWNYNAQVADVIAEFSDWHRDVVRIIEHTPPGECKCWALYTRKPLTSWTLGLIGLLGDAAHPMTPFFGMGAAMAIEDAWILARCFSACDDDWGEALRRYEAARLDRGNQMQAISLERAEIYMSNKSEDRQQAPRAGLEAMQHYNPVTALI